LTEEEKFHFSFKSEGAIRRLAKSPVESWCYVMIGCSKGLKLS
jgi:hypothetical protein